LKLEYNLSEIKNISNKILTIIKTPKTLLFYGEMGVGKTTLIKEIVFQLGVKDATSSPTFSIVNEYIGKNCKIFHFDFYRINDENEVYDIGIEEYFYQNCWSLVEWPEKIPNIIPDDSVVIKLSKNQNNTRTIEIYNS
jgi:tRNA threonylcarbamoyladenosine biosynthesis protein TsaE